MSIVKKSALKFRTFDSKEVARISLHETYKQVISSRAVILHMLSPDRGEVAHNARCAFIAGMAMAAQKHVLMLQEGGAKHAIDFRDVVKTYKRASKIFYPRHDSGIPVSSGIAQPLHFRARQRTRSPRGFEDACLTLPVWRRS